MRVIIGTVIGWIVLVALLCWAMPVHAGGLLMSSGAVSTPVGFWPLNETSGTNAPDASGNGNNGTLVNMEDADWVDGKVNKALIFDGVNELVTIPNSPTFGTGDFSISLWVNSGLIDSAYHVVLDHGFNAGDTRYRIAQTASNKWEFSIANILLPSIDNAVVDTWYHVVGVREGDAFYIYIDGELKNTGSGVAAKVISPTDNLTLAQRSDQTNTSPFDGLIDEVRIYDRALTAQEIKALYVNP